MNETFVQGGHVFRIHPEKAVEDAKKILEWWAQKPEKNLPQENLPDFVRANPLQHAQYLLNTTAVDFIQDSVRIYGQARKFAETHFKETGEFILDPQIVASYGSGEDFKKAHFDSFSLSPTYKYDYMFKNALKLLELQEQGKTLLDVPKMHENDLPKTKKFLTDSFCGLGDETVDLYLRFMLATDLFHFKSEDDLRLKIDRHKLRLPFMFKWMTYEGGLPSHEVYISRSGNLENHKNLYAYIAKELATSETIDTIVHDLDEALWGLARNCRPKKLSHCQAYCTMYDACNGLAFLNSNTRNKVKKNNRADKRLREEREIPLVEAYDANDSQIQEVLNERAEVNFYDLVSGEKVDAIINMLYPFVDARNDDLPPKEQGNLF